MKDIDYFREEYLDAINIRGFYDSLPSHLQTAFNAVNKTNILDLSVLQGYRGPASFCNGGSGCSEALDSVHGIQEIRIWWGVRKVINYVPLLGTLIFAIGRLVQTTQSELEWQSFYFEQATGCVVSHVNAQQIRLNNRNAEELHKEGIALDKHGKYVEAAEKFEGAYNKCSSGYKKKLFKSNRDKSQAEVDAISIHTTAEQLFTVGKYKEAIAKYQQAYDKSSASANKAKCTSAIRRTKTELEAANLKELGDKEFKSRRYNCAKIKYQEAYNKSSVAAIKANYTACVNKAEMYNSVFTNFQRTFNSEMTVGELRTFRASLDTLMDDSEYQQDSLIVKLFLVVSLRMAKEEMQNQLGLVEGARHGCEEHQKLRLSIANLIESEIKVLHELNICDSKLEQELKLLDKELRDDEESDHNVVVFDLTPIANRAGEIEEVIKGKHEYEKLTKSLQIELGTN